MSDKIMTYLKYNLTNIKSYVFAKYVFSQHLICNFSKGSYYCLVVGKAFFVIGRVMYKSNLASSKSIRKSPFFRKQFLLTNNYIRLWLLYFYNLYLIMTTYIYIYMQSNNTFFYENYFLNKEAKIMLISILYIFVITRIN